MNDKFFDHRIDFTSRLCVYCGCSIEAINHFKWYDCQASGNIRSPEERNAARMEKALRENKDALIRTEAGNAMLDRLDRLNDIVNQEFERALAAALRAEVRVEVRLFMNGEEIDAEVAS